MAAVSQHAMRRHPGGPLDPSPSFGSTPYFAIAHQQVSFMISRILQKFFIGFLSKNYKKFMSYVDLDACTSTSI